ncbi:hypothetical protein M4D52_22800 [Paenibacillus lactis]|nr:hypothetical protein [Paenibacillus lactis]MCM3496287.1 hypothetical protein [Paenibacillus lactis]
MKAAKWLKQMLVLSMNLLEQEAGPLNLTLSSRQPKKAALSNPSSVLNRTKVV